MRFIKKYLCISYIRGIVLSILFIFLECSIYTDVVAALGSESGMPSTQNTENISDVDRDGDWKFHDLDGTAFELGQFKGKVIFINIWATWCMPCVFEMQSIQKLYDAYKTEDIVFLIASNEDKNTVQKFYKENKYTFPVYLIHPQLPYSFQSTGFPSTFIIDRKGNIVLRHLGAADWNDKSCHEFISSLLSNMDSEKIAKPFSDSGDKMKDQRLNMTRTLITSRLGPFLEQNDLPPDVKTKLIDIRVEEQLQMMELSSGNIPLQSRLIESNRIRSDCDEKITRLLSEENYYLYRGYKIFENELATISQINKELIYNGMKLEKGQAHQLAAAMYNDRQNMMAIQIRQSQQKGNKQAQSQEDMRKKSLEYQKELYSMYTDSAKNILTESQLHIFKRYFDNKSYMIERSLINRSQ